MVKRKKNDTHCSTNEEKKCLLRMAERKPEGTMQTKEVRKWQVFDSSSDHNNKNR